MSELIVLIEEIRKSCEALAKISRFFDGAAAGLRKTGRTEEKAVVIAESLCKYYTCLETIFLRISQFFENALAQDRWHADLLEKMTLRIRGVRPAVIRLCTRDLLRELLKFRHFTRYYYEISYDWDRLEFLMKTFRRVRPMVKQDVKQFLLFLEGLRRASTRKRRKQA